MSIEVTYLGAMHCKGVGKNGAYDFCQVKYMADLESVSKENRQVVAYGAEESTLDLDPSKIHDFSKFTPGQRVLLEVGPNPKNLNRNLCTGAAAKS